MKYLEEKELVKGTEYLCKTYEEEYLFCRYMGVCEFPFHLAYDNQVILTWGDIRYVLETVASFEARKLYE